MQCITVCCVRCAFCLLCGAKLACLDSRFVMGFNQAFPPAPPPLQCCHCEHQAHPCWQRCAGPLPPLRPHKAPARKAGEPRDHPNREDESRAGADCALAVSDEVDCQRAMRLSQPSTWQACLCRLTWLLGLNNDRLGMCAGRLKAKGGELTARHGVCPCVCLVP